MSCAEELMELEKVERGKGKGEERMKRGRRNEKGEQGKE